MDSSLSAPTPIIERFLPIEEFVIEVPLYIQ